MTTAESFLWYSAHPRVQLGVALLWKQGAVRYLASVRISPETATLPGINLSAGVQGIGTGNPGYAATFEKNWDTTSGKFNAFAGIGFRSNENHAHALGGFKFSPAGSPFTVGLQLDGHDKHAFVTYTNREWSYGLYLIKLQSPALMVGVRF